MPRVESRRATVADRTRPSTCGGIQDRRVDVDRENEPDPERDASRERTEDVAEELDALRRVQFGRADPSSRRRNVIVARPAARRLRTHWTSPHGAQTQRLPETSMIATGVVRGRPLFRPRMVMSPLKPSGTPAAKRNLATGPKRGTYQGRRRIGTSAALPIRSVMCRSIACAFEVSTEMTLTSTRT